MSPRPKSIRKVENRPVVAGLKPVFKRMEQTGCVILHYEEYEAALLCDYEDRTQQEACISMGGGRPTFSRIYTQARRKMARALIEGRALIIGGGTAYTESEWFARTGCGFMFNNIHPGCNTGNLVCPRCHSREIQPDKDIQLKSNDMTTKIAIPTRNNAVDAHFGHCEFYTVLTVSGDNRILGAETIPSPQGCGCKSNIAGVLQGMGVSVMLAGNMGQGALNVLSAHDIKVFRGCSGNALDVATAYLKGWITDSGTSCSAHGEYHECHHSHHSDNKGNKEL